ncbi:MAG: hypothetical protein PVI04_04925 [Anaerolineales bacterium]|jgi:hypothetical protein
MKTNLILKATIVFGVLFSIGVGLVVVAARLAAQDLQQVLVPVGSAILGGALAFYLVEMFAIERSH